MSLLRLLPLLIAPALAAGCAGQPTVSRDPLAVLVKSEAQWQSVEVDPARRPAGDGEELCWPLYATLADEAPAGYRDCSRDPAPLACMARARHDGAAAALLRLGMGDDSMYGWALLQRSDGRVIRYTYDSSPCGGIVPSACGYRLERSDCEAVSALQADPAAQRALCDKPYFGAKPE